MTHNTYTLGTYTLPLTDAQKVAIHRAARREQAQAITASIRAAGRAVARLLATRPAALRPAAPLGGRAAGHAG